MKDKTPDRFLLNKIFYRKTVSFYFHNLILGKADNFLINIYLSGKKTGV